MSEFEVTTGGEKIVGPVSLDQLRRGLVAGKVPPDAKARAVGSTDWLPIAVVIASVGVGSNELRDQPASAAASKEVGKRAPRYTGLLIGLGVVVIGVGLVGALKFGARTTTATSTSTSSASSAASSAAQLDPEAAAKKGFELFDKERSDEAGAVKLWGPACEAKNELGCVGMGTAYLFGVGGVKADHERGKSLIEPACTNGNQRACSVLGQIFYNGWGVPKDIEKAKTLWSAACDADVGRACYFVGLTAWASDGPPAWRDEKGGEDLLRKSCSLGYRSACEQVGKIDQGKEIRKLRAKVTVKWWGFEKDGTCTGKGLPPYRKDYEGGTFDENERVAKHDGCKSPFQSRDDALRNTFCCPYEENK